MADAKAVPVGTLAGYGDEMASKAQELRCGLLHDLSVPALFELLRHSCRRTCAGGESLFKEGDPPTEVFILHRGRVRLSLNGGGDDSLTLNLFEPGTVLGLGAIVTGHLHGTTAVTLWPSELDVITREDFLDFLDKHREAWLPISRQLTEYYESACGRLRTLGVPGNAIAKLAHLLLDWVKTGEDGALRETFVLPVSNQEEIGRMIGVSRETTNRLMRELKRRGIAQVKGSVLHILDPQGLTQLSLE